MNVETEFPASSSIYGSADVLTLKMPDFPRARRMTVPSGDTSRFGTIFGGRWGSRPPGVRPDAP